LFIFYDKTAAKKSATKVQFFSKLKEKGMIISDKGL